MPEGSKALVHGERGREEFWLRGLASPMVLIHLGLYYLCTLIFANISDKELQIGSSFIYLEQLLPFSSKLHEFV